MGVEGRNVYSVLPTLADNTCSDLLMPPVTYIQQKLISVQRTTGMIMELLSERLWSVFDPRVSFPNIWMC